MIYQVLADVVLIVHLGFVVFAVLGGVAVYRWPRLAWLHVPAAVWSVLIEYRNWICPLTPLENRLRRRAGTEGYEGSFVEHYLLPVLYPEALTRDVQIVLGSLVLMINLAVYGFLLSRSRIPGTRKRPERRDP